MVELCQFYFSSCLFKLLAVLAPEEYARLNGVLDDWCTKVGRDPSDIERTVAVQGDDAHDIGRYVDAGADHIIVMTGAPFDLSALQTLIDQRDSLA